MAEHKKALSEAASFFVWSPSSLGLKGASSPFLVDPARRNRRALAALNTRHLLRKPVCGLKAPLGLSCPPGTAVLSGSLLVSKENNPRPAAAHRNRRALAALNTRHLLRKPVCGLKAPLGLSCPPGTAVLSGSLLVPKENNPRPAPAHRNRRALAALNTRHLLRKPVCGLKAPLGLSCPPGTAVLSGSLLSVKREHPLSKPLSPAAPPPPAGPARPAGRRPAAPRSRSAPRRCRAAHAEPARPQRPLPAP